MHFHRDWFPNRHEILSLWLVTGDLAMSTRMASLFSLPFCLHADGQRLDCRVDVARSFAQRAGGLLVRSPLGSAEGLWIDRCPSIHTVGMRYAIDVLFLDADGVVLRVAQDVPPFRFRWCKGARSVLELRAGQARHWGLERGMRLSEHLCAIDSA